MRISPKPPLWRLDKGGITVVEDGGGVETTWNRRQ